MRDIYSIIVCINTFDLTEGYLQYHQPDSHNESFDLTEGYLQYHQPDSHNESFDLTMGYLQYHIRRNCKYPSVRPQVSIHTMIL
jgi:hypothetical protein